MSTFLTRQPRSISRQSTSIGDPAYYQSAAHRCFSIPEILHYTIEFLDDRSGDSHAWKPEKATYKDLLSAALVCRTWSHPALDLIWHTQPSLVPLLMLLPSDSWGIKVKKRYGLAVSRTLVLRRRLELQDLMTDRFRSYAYRIRVLTLNRGSQCHEINIDRNFAKALSCLFKDEEVAPFLPCLHHLDMAFEDEEPASDISIFKLVMRPFVRNLRLSLILPHCYHSILPQLVSGFDGSVSENWKSLTRLDLYNSFLAGPSKGAHALTYIGRLPALRTLSINLSGETFACIHEYCGVDQLFESLRSLNIHNIIASLKEAIQFLVIFRPRLTSLEVSCYLGVSVSSFLEFAAELAHPSICNQLETLKFSTGFCDSTEFPPFPNEFFSILTALPCLHTIHLRLYNRVCLTDEILSKLAPSWPNLTTFDVVGFRPPPPPGCEQLFVPVHSLPTFRGIASLCAQCPKLTRLALEVDPRVLPFPTLQTSLNDSDSEAASDEENTCFKKNINRTSTSLPVPASDPPLSLHIYKTPVPTVDELERLDLFLEHFLPRLERVSATPCREAPKWDRLQELLLLRRGRN